MIHVGPPSRVLINYKLLGPCLGGPSKTQLNHGWLHFIGIFAGPHIVVSFEDQWSCESGQTNWNRGVELAGANGDGDDVREYETYTLK